jgi:hypothetical protein
LLAAGFGRAESTGAVTGRVADPSGRAVPKAEIVVRHLVTGVERKAATNGEGLYEFPALPAGTYRMSVVARGFRLHVVERLTTEVASTSVQDVHLEIGDLSQQVTVGSPAAPIDRETISVGQVVDQRTIQEIPLNGRYFLDLALIVPGSVTPPQNGYSTSPSRGVGALAINTAGNREETVNYMVNGITLNNLAFSSISFQPSISTVQEFKVDNSTFSAEYGQSSGAVINIATRSGGAAFHGELFEFVRNEKLDARNFFNFTSSSPPPFKRNQFGASLGGPIVRSRTFFFFSCEGLRQRQGVDVNTVVPSDAQRASVTDPAIGKLMQFIPRANFRDEQGTARFVGAAPAPSNSGQWTMDISHNLATNNWMHGYYAMQRVDIGEPVRAGNTIPGFGHNFAAQRQIFTLNDTHTFRPDLVNEARFGANRIFGIATPNVEVDAEEFGIHTGVRRPIGLPQFNVAGAFNFGGPANQPVGRGDTTFVASDMVSYLRGSHSLKFGGEFRQFLSNNFALDPGQFNFASVDAFLAGTANSFSVSLGDRTNSLAEGALGMFAQDNYKWRPHVMLELGLRYDWNLTPSERYNGLIVFDPASASLLRVGRDIRRVYHDNRKNFQPRLGFAWDPSGSGRTSVRAAYAILVDQPMTSVVTGAAANPPLVTPLTFTGLVRPDNAVDLAQATGLAPQTVDHGFANAYVQSWNFNVQRELRPGLAVMAGYFGSKGTHLILRRNINQSVGGLRPFSDLSLSSPILPGARLGNITQVESTGNSNYNALWATASQRFTRQLTYTVSYSWSKSLDYNSLSSQGVVVQDSYNLRGDRGPSDFDARHRVAVTMFYELPLRGNRVREGWQLAANVQVQSGNPVNFVTSDSVVNGVANTLRPNVAGPIQTTGKVEQWFDTSALTPLPQFGNLGRNVITGPGFLNADLSIVKNMNFSERVRMQFRLELFDSMNHANLGQPGRIVGSPAFGRITSTRFPTGESGSSRQAQFALKFHF